MSDPTYSGLSVGIKTDEFTNDVLVGAEVGGAFVPISRLSQGRFQKYLDRAQQQQPEPGTAGNVEPPAQQPSSTDQPSG